MAKLITENQNSMKDIKALCDQVRQTAYDIHVYHAHGHLEKVYENALVHRLRKAGLEVKQQQPITVYDEDGTLIGDYLADLLVEGVLIVELKTAKTIAPEHEAQILGYLKSARLLHGLLINFGSYKLKSASLPGRNINRRKIDLTAENIKNQNSMAGINHKERKELKERELKERTPVFRRV